MMREAVYGVLLAFAGFLLTPLGLLYVRRRRSTIQRTLGVFVGVMVTRLSIAFGGGMFFQKSGGNPEMFLLTFATVFTILLIPEVMVIIRAMR